MKIFKYISFILLLFLVSNSYVFALDCDSDDINYLKQLSKRITYHYDYIGDSRSDTNSQTYEIYFSGLGSEFSAVIEDDGNRLVFSDDVRQYVLSGKKNFTIYSNKCYVTLDVLNVELPKFNEYSVTAFCQNNKDVDICNAWYQGKISSSEYERIVDEYSSNNISLIDQIGNLFKNYCYVLIPAFIVLLIIFILVINKNIKKNKLD